MKNFLNFIDSLNAWTGKIIRLLAVALVLVMTVEVTMRYVFNHPTMWGYETSIMVGAAMYALAWGNVHRENAHVRVDLIYSRLSARGKALIDALCTFFLFVPLVGLLSWMAFSWMARAWKIGEKSVETYWYPPIAPLRTAVFIGLVLFGLQGLAQFIRDVYLLARNKKYD